MQDRGVKLTGMVQLTVDTCYHRPAFWWIVAIR
jgi:hypothetical protein